MISNTKFLLLITLTLTLCACTHINNDNLHLTNINVAQNTYRITFEGKKNTDVYQIQDYLIYKVAKLTLQNNHKYFEIIEDKYNVTREHRGRPLIAYTVAVVKPLKSRYIEHVTGVITIKMLDTNDNPKAMDAASIINSFDSAKK